MGSRQLGVKEMKQTFFIVLVLLTLANSARADRVEPRLEMENIFPPGGKHAHSSSIVECPDGDLLCCWFYGSGERSGTDVVVQGARKKRGASNWSPVFLLADTPEFPDCNPVLWVDRQQRVWLFWITVLAERWECCQLKYRRADEPGGDAAPNWSWQGLIQLKPGKAFGQVMQERFEQLHLAEGMWAEYARPYSRLLL